MTEFKINVASNETQCKCCGRGGIKTITLQHQWKSDEIEIGQCCLETALIVVKHGT